MKKIKYCAIAVLFIVGSFCTACEGKEDTLKEVGFNNKNIEINKENGDEDMKSNFGDDLKNQMIKSLTESQKTLDLVKNINGEEINFKAERVKTGSYTQGMEFPYTRVYTKEGQYKSDKYNEDFFKTKALIVIGLRETSGSIRHEVKKVTKEDGKINIKIDRIVPEIGTADMAEWEIYIEVNKADIGDITEVNLVI